VLDEGGLDELGLGPEVRGEEAVGLLESLEGSSTEVLSGSGLSGTGGVNIIDTGEVQDLLGHGGGNATSSSGGGDESDSAGSALTLGLDDDGVDSSDLGTPVSSSDGHDVELGIDEGSLDGDLDLLGDLDSNSNVSLSVSDGDDDLESGSLTGGGLLLHGEDAHDLVGELSLDVGEESVDDGGLLDGDRVGVDLLELVDLSSLDESSELGGGGPLILSSHSSSSSGTTSSSTSASSGSESSASGATSASRSITLGSTSLDWSSSNLLFTFHFIDCV